MMIIYVNGSLFDSPAQVIVNTVNTVGIMGKGIAKTFKKVYPDMFIKYREFCDKKVLDIGKLYLYKTPGKWVLNFPTKKDWRNPSKIEYIELGLQKFVSTYREKQIKSIAFPKLGCGNGGLDFDSLVKPLMEKYLNDLDIDVYVYLEKDVEEKEFVNISKTKKWLNENIQNISVSEFIRDIINESDGLAVQTDDGSILVNKESINYEAFVAFLSYIRDNNITIKDETISKFFLGVTKETIGVLDLILEKIDYININRKNIDGKKLIVYEPYKKGGVKTLC